MAASPPGVPDAVSPDGRFLLQRACASTAGNAWICQPRLRDERAGRTLLDLWAAEHSEWDCYDVRFAGGTVELQLRRFPGSVGGTFAIDADALTYAVRDPLRGGKGLEPVHADLRRHGLVPA